MTGRKNLLALLVIFIILVVLVTLQDTPETVVIIPTAEPVLTPTRPGLLRVFPDLTVLDIEAVRLENPVSGKTLTLQRDRSGQWTAPDLDGTLDTDAATTIARTLVLLPYGTSINILSSTRLEDYGFDTTPYLLIQIIKRDGGGHGIIIGDIDPDNPAYYALVDERDEIFRVERGAIDFLNQLLDLPPVNLTK